MFKDTSVVGVAHFISLKNVSILSASQPRTSSGISF
jgi:hypothetical protein